MRISQLMTRHVQVVPSTMPAWEAWEVMRHHEIHHLVVRDKGEIVGILSDADAGGRCGGTLRVGTTVGHLMTPHVTGAAPGDSVQDVARRMQSLKLECLVVLGHGRLLGIVTLTDLLGVLAEASTSNGSVSLAAAHPQDGFRAMNPSPRSDLTFLEGPHSRRRELWLVLKTVRDFIAGFRTLHLSDPA